LFWLTKAEGWDSLTPLPMRKKRAIFLLAGFLVFLAVFLLKAGKEMADFEVNDKAGRRLLAGETLYRADDQHWQFKYSPFSAIVYVPLSFLPLQAAKGIWFFAIVASTWIIIAYSSKLVRRGASAKMVWPLLAFLILARYFFRELQLGQINAIVTAILVGMIWQIDRDEETLSTRRRTLAGLFWGLATALKPYAVIFLPYFILKRHFRAAAVGICVVILSLAVPAIFYGVQGDIAVVTEWASSLAQSTPHLFTTQDNVSLLAFVSKWLKNQSLALIVFASAVAILALFTLRLILAGKTTTRPALLECALLLLFIPLLSPLGWDYTFLSSFTAVLLVLERLKSFPKSARVFLSLNFVLIAFTLYDVLGRTIYASYMSWSVPTLSFLIIAGALFYLRQAKNA
jgi:alpha-1,2-mannosyltransferase